MTRPGADRTKSGFFVDNFANHAFTDTKNHENRSTIDPQNKFMRPGKKETVIDLFYDSAQTKQLNTTKTGDLITLDYTLTDWYKQDVASRTENLNPFFIEKVVGSLTLSPLLTTGKRLISFHHRSLTNLLYLIHQTQ